MAHQRFVFSSGRPGSRPGVPPVTWRLLGANNRALAVSSTPAVDEGLARMELAALMLSADLLVPQVYAQNPGHLWAWRLLLGTEAVVLSARSYHRHREASSAMGLTLEALTSIALPGELAAPA